MLNDLKLVNDLTHKRQNTFFSIHACGYFLCEDLLYKSLNLIVAEIPEPLSEAVGQQPGGKTGQQPVVRAGKQPGGKAGEQPGGEAGQQPRG